MSTATKTHRFAPLLTLLLAASLPGQETDPALRDELMKLASRAKDVRDLTVEFVQHRHTPLLKKPLESRGRVLVKGGRTRWETDKPRASVTLIDDKQLRIYYPELKTLEVYALDRRVGELAASPIPDVAVLFHRFHVRRIERNDDPDRLWLRLTPADESTGPYLDHVLVAIDRETGLAERVSWEDADGERTELEFSDPVVNGGLTEEQMDLSPPPGTKVIHPLDGGDSR